MWRTEAKITRHDDLLSGSGLTQPSCAGLAFVGNGKHLVSAGRDASVCFWSPSADSGEKFVADRMARLQSAYEGGKAPHARSPVLVRRGPEPRSSLSYMHAVDS